MLEFIEDCGACGSAVQLTGLTYVESVGVGSNPVVRFFRVSLFLEYCIVIYGERPRKVRPKIIWGNSTAP